jgi:hypothetical protein
MQRQMLCSTVRAHTQTRTAQSLNKWSEMMRI